MFYLCGFYRYLLLLSFVHLFRQISRVHGIEISDNILNYTTALLDSLLAGKNYDRQLRPDFGGPATVVSTNIEIRSFGPVSESEMIYSMDCYFRQKWIDSRLRFESDRLDVLPMNYKFLQKVWVPDTFFLNGKSSYLHKVTVPNKFIRLRKNGELKYSMRLTIKANCPMHLRKYPLDTQGCPLEIGSFAYPAHEVIYDWQSDSAVDLHTGVKLSQYDIRSISTSNLTSIKPRGEKRSTLLVYFVLQRRRGYFILQIYAPCALIVGASWVSFWINRADAAARVAVGATTVLTLVTMGFGGRSSLQRVAYATALDWFVIMCFTFVFAALVEYAFVNFIDHCEKQQMKNYLEKERAKKKEIKEEIGDTLEDVQVTTGGPEETVSPATKPDETLVTGFQQKSFKPQSGSIVRPTRLGTLRLRQRRFAQPGSASLSTEGYHNRQIAGKVDSYARVAFPLTFAILNVFYWTFFLHTMGDEIDVGFGQEISTDIPH